MQSGENFYLPHAHIFQLKLNEIMFYLTYRKQASVYNVLNAMCYFYFLWLLLIKFAFQNTSQSMVLFLNKNMHKARLLIDQVIKCEEALSL